MGAGRFLRDPLPALVRLLQSTKYHQTWTECMIICALRGCMVGDVVACGLRDLV